MAARRLAINAVLVAVIAFAVGHFLAIWHCQRDQLLAVRGEGQPSPGSAQPTSGQILGERRAAAAAGLIAIGAAACLGAGTLAETLALFLVGYAVLGLTMTAELVILGYRRVPWPLLPLGPGENATSVLLAFALLTLLIGGALYRAAAIDARAEPGATKRSARPRAARRQPVGRSPSRPSRPRDDTEAQPTEPDDWEDRDARSED